MYSPRHQKRITACGFRQFSILNRARLTVGAFSWIVDEFVETRYEPNDVLVPFLESDTVSPPTDPTLIHNAVPREWYIHRSFHLESAEISLPNTADVRTERYPT